MSNQILRHALGLAVFFLVGAAVGIAYVVVVGKLLERGGDGFGLVGALFVFPVLGLGAGIAWIAVWAVHRRVAGAMTWPRTLVASVVLALVAGLLIAGPRGFTMAGGATLFNYFIFALLVPSALVHRALLAGVDAAPRGGAGSSPSEPAAGPKTSA